MLSQQKLCIFTDVMMCTPWCDIDKEHAFYYCSFRNPPCWKCCLWCCILHFRTVFQILLLCLILFPSLCGLQGLLLLLGVQCTVRTQSTCVLQCWQYMQLFSSKTQFSSFSISDTYVQMLVLNLARSVQTAVTVLSPGASISWVCTQLIVLLASLPLVNPSLSSV